MLPRTWDVLLQWRSLHESPVVEHHLGESLSTSGLSELSSKTERFVDRQVSLDGVPGQCMYNLAE